MPSHPLRNLESYTPDEFIAHTEQLLGDEAAVLSVPSDDLLRFIPERVIRKKLNQYFPKPSAIEYIAEVIPLILSPGSSVMGAAIKHGATKAVKSHEQQQHRKGLSEYVINQPVIGLSDAQLAIIRQTANLSAASLITPSEWARFLALAVWNGGNCIVEPTGRAATGKSPFTHKLLLELLREYLPESSAFERESAATAARLLKPAALPSTASHGNIFTRGQRWMKLADLTKNTVYSTTASPSSLLIGYEETSGKPVYFPGHESIITIAAPGTGKSQAQIIPNLLRYKGSAIVLDVKGELWQATAGYRAKHFGRVFRFAPTDPTGNTNRYNPFDFISTDPVTAAAQCNTFAHQIIPDNPELKDPYWENRARDFLWAFALWTSIKCTGAMRTIQGLAQVMSTPLTKGPDTDIQLLIGSMRRVGERTGIKDLVATANAIASGLNSKDRLESVMDSGRRYLAVFSRSPTVTATMSATDWQPRMFRQNPGTTLYICLSAQELKTYAPIVRAMLTQHVEQLQPYAANPDEPPITFFLDEMPQLGNFKSILELQDLGRGAGLRLWMLAQYVGQLAEAFGDQRYSGVIESCRVRCFMRPDNKALEFIEPSIGKTRNLITGREEPLASAADLMGPLFSDKLILTSAGQYPMSLDKRFAWQTDKAMFLSPPRVR